MMMRALTLALLCALSACIPLAPQTYYAPRATQGVVVTDQCWRTPDELRLTLQGVEVGVRAAERDGRRWLVLDVGVPTGVTAEFSQAEFGVAADGRRSDTRLAGFGLSSTPPETFSALAPMQGPSAGAPVELRHYWAFAPLPAGAVDEIRAALPPLTINGVAHPLPEVTLEASTSVRFFAPIQC